MGFYRFIRPPGQEECISLNFPKNKNIPILWKIFPVISSANALALVIIIHTWAYNVHSKGNVAKQFSIRLEIQSILALEDFYFILIGIHHPHYLLVYILSCILNFNCD